MNIVKHIAREQCAQLVNEAAQRIGMLQKPKESWITIVRKALGMSGAQLARRLNVTRGHISKTEKAELSGSVTIKTMDNMARGMNCRFVYAIVPEKSVEDILKERAEARAKNMVEKAALQGAMENQGLSKDQMIKEIERLKNELLREMPSDFWNDFEVE